MSLVTAPCVTSLSAWKERASSHRARAEKHTLPARMRRARGLPHPVHDFLFQYYPFPFSLLENWHPAAGEALEWPSPAPPPEFPEKWYVLDDGRVALDPGRLPEKARQRMVWTLELLEATRDRAPNFGCHGLHEWAMVYRGREIRHEKTLRLRLPQAEIDALVESRAICCSHHDAFRFFAPEARPLNRLQPDIHSRHRHEQPACLHANMDLYKWAAKSMPWIGSELLLDCFELAMQLRALDMRASPYDLTEWAYDPVPIETAAGRAVYENEQRRLADAAAPLRQRLIEVLRRMIEPAA
ncbi:MAG TPA: hypothetical protein VLO11_07365 [Luteolibacter sp.]|nr:hypothetical protein [Luteolibacter sp.]